MPSFFKMAFRNKCVVVLGIPSHRFHHILFRFFKLTMIKKITINNFQSHESSELKLSEGVNVIVGSSDSGKSAILRALKWVIYGKPRGDAFCSWWGGKTSVNIEFDDCSVSRSKEGNDNKYILLDSDENKKVFTAFGNDIPAEITNALNIDDINFQKQGDAPFLISNTSGEVAAHFNRMANLEQIDNSVRYIQSEINSTEQSIKTKKQDYDEKVIQYKKLNYIDAIENMVSDIETLENKKIKVSNGITKISAFIASINSIDDEVSNLQYVVKADNAINDIVELFAAKNEVQTNTNTLDSFITKIQTIDKKIEWAEKYIQSEPLINKIVSQFDELKNTKIDYKDLCNYINEINNTTNTIEVTNINVLSLEKEYEKVTPDICPLCDQKIPHAHSK